MWPFVVVKYDVKQVSGNKFYNLMESFKIHGKI